jgi:hypothetical protein
LLVKHFGYKILDMKKIEEDLRKQKGNDDGPYEGPIDA